MDPSSWNISKKRKSKHNLITMGLKFSAPLAGKIADTAIWSSYMGEEGDSNSSNTPRSDQYSANRKFGSVEALTLVFVVGGLR